MKKGMRRQRSHEDQIHLPPPSPHVKLHRGGTQSAPPTPPSSDQKRTRGKSPARKLACTFRALKCSSRASESDHVDIHCVPVDFDAHRAGEEMIAALQVESPVNTYRMENGPLPALSNRNISSSEPPRFRSSGSVGSYESESTSSLLLELSGIEADSTPFEDSDGEGDPAPSTPTNIKRVNYIQDTPNASNRDPSKPESQRHVKTVPDEAFDKLCQRNFNKPRVPNHSLGDAISPIASPDYLEETQASSSLDSNTREGLMIPSMEGQQIRPAFLSLTQSETSGTSFLFGECISDERKEELHLEQEISSRTCNRVETAQPQEDESMIPEDTSHSTVSSFVDVAMPISPPKPKSRKSTKPAFFWRSHPIETIHSYHSHYYQHHHQQHHSQEFDIHNFSSCEPIQRQLGGPAGLRKPWQRERQTRSQPIFHSSNSLIKSFTSLTRSKMPPVFQSDSVRISN